MLSLIWEGRASDNQCPWETKHGSEEPRKKNNAVGEANGDKWYELGMQDTEGPLEEGYMYLS